MTETSSGTASPRRARAPITPSAMVSLPAKIAVTSGRVDPKSVETYGLVLNPISEFGQTEWSYLAASTGWRPLDQPWSTTYHYDDPRLAETFAWLRDLGTVKGFTPTADQQGKLGGEAQPGRQLSHDREQALRACTRRA